MHHPLSQQTKVKLHFLIKKKVAYGSAVYVIGNIPTLGQWYIQHALKLNWNQDDYWSGFVEVELPHHYTNLPHTASSSTCTSTPTQTNPFPQSSTQPVLKIQYKYIITEYEHPTHNIEWEQGQFNRQLVIQGDEENIVIENIWNANKICLNLLVPKFLVKSELEVEIYLAGGCNQLGNWKNRLKMQKNSMNNLSDRQIAKARQTIIIQNYQVYTVTLSVQRNLRCFNYYFIKKTGNEFLPDRIPQRQFKIDVGQNWHPTCLHISSKTSNYQLLELSRFAQLYYSKITDQIYIGGTIQTIDDVKELKKRGINAIIYLTSSEDVRLTTGPKNLVRMISEEHKIQYHTLKIQLQKERTVLEQAKCALELLDELLENQEKIVYVYCSTGTLLSPLLVALYLYTRGSLSLKRALEYVKEKHPISAIDERIMVLANEITRERIFQREIRVEENVIMVQEEEEDITRQMKERKAMQNSNERKMKKGRIKMQMEIEMEEGNERYTEEMEVMVESNPREMDLNDINGKKEQNLKINYRKIEESEKL